MTQNTWENVHSKEHSADSKPNMRPGAAQPKQPSLWKSQGDSSNLQVLVQCSRLDSKHSVAWDVRTALNERKKKSTTILHLSFNNTDGRSEAASGKPLMILHEGKKMPEFIQPATARWLWVVQPGILKHTFFSD